MCGKAVIASDAGGLSDIVVNGKTGLLVPPRDDVRLQTAVEELLADEPRRVGMGDAGRVRAEEFMASRVTKDVEKVLGDVLAQRNAYAQYARSSVW